MSRADLDLKLSAAVALVAILVATTIDVAVVRTLPAILLVLFVPGYVLSIVLLPAPRETFERCLLALGLSLCIDVLGGLLIDRTGFGLTARSWSLGLGLFTLGACVVARQSRSVAKPAPEPTPTVRPKGASTDRRRLATAAMAIAAIAGVAGAVLIARLPSSSAHIEGFTSLWIEPVNSAAGVFTVGVRSDELRKTSYRLVTTSLTTRKILAQRNVTLAPGRQVILRGRVSVPRDGTAEQVEAALYKSGRPRVAYRHVDLTLQANAR